MLLMMCTANDVEENGLNMLVLHHFGSRDSGSAVRSDLADHAPIECCNQWLVMVVGGECDGSSYASHAECI